MIDDTSFDDISADKTSVPDTRREKKVSDVELFRIREGGDVKIWDLAYHYLCLKAIDGDKIAQDLLNAAEITVHDVDGNQIYPIIKKEDPDGTSTNE